MKKRILFLVLVLLLTLFGIASAIPSVRCPACNFPMYWTGQQQGTHLFLMRCAAGHEFWVRE